MAARIVSAVKPYAGRLAAVVLVVGVFAFVLPRVADYSKVWDAITELSTLGVISLIAAAILNLATFGPPWMDPLYQKYATLAQGHFYQEF